MIISSFTKLVFCQSIMDYGRPLSQKQQWPKKNTHLVLNAKIWTQSSWYDPAEELKAWQLRSSLKGKPPSVLLSAVSFHKQVKTQLTQRSAQCWESGVCTMYSKTPTVWPAWAFSLGEVHNRMLWVYVGKHLNYRSKFDHQILSPIKSKSNNL